MIRSISTALNAYLSLRTISQSVGGTTPPDTISIISMPRSGSTYFCDLLSKHPNIYSCFEIFHRKKLFSCDSESLVDLLNSRFGRSFYGNDDPNLIDFAHKEGDKVLEALRTLSGNRVLSFKIFPCQLSSGQFAKLVLGERRMAKILFKRDLLSAYVSREKAKKVRKWEFSETTGVRVALDGRDFRDFVSKATEWFGLTERLLNRSGQKYVVMNYEELTAISTDFARLAYVVEKIRTLGLALKSLEELGVGEVEINRQRQDRTDKFEDKIENFDQFRDQLKKLNLECYLG